MATPSPSPLWSTSYIYAPGVPNPSSPSVPSSMSSESSDFPSNVAADALQAAAPTASLTAAAPPSIPKHWRRVTTLCSVEAIEDPAKPGQGVTEKDLLEWLCQILAGELRAQGSHSGTPPLDLLRKAITSSLTDAERTEFFEGLRRLKK